MRVYSLHEREYTSDADSVGALIDSLATPMDRLWPAENWPPMRLNDHLKVGARGGHGPIRYFVEQYVPERMAAFRFLAPRGFEGTHGFELEDRNGQAVLRHILRMQTSGLAVLTWPLVFRPLHDALIENALDKAAVSLGHGVDRRVGWSLYVRVLRALFKTLSRMGKRMRYRRSKRG